MIGPIENQPIRLDRTQQAGKGTGESKEAAAQPRKADRVEISPEARQRAADLDTVAGLSPERTAEIRRKLADGSYGTDEVLGQVAQRMIERGDV